MRRMKARETNGKDDELGDETLPAFPLFPFFPPSPSRRSADWCAAMCGDG